MPLVDEATAANRSLTGRDAAGNPLSGAKDEAILESTEAALNAVFADDSEVPDAEDEQAEDQTDDSSVEDDDEDDAGDVAEEEATAPCTYPGGPYAFRAIGDNVGPMAWPSAVPGSEETSTAADLEEFFCDPDVHSVFVLVTNTT